MDNLFVFDLDGTIIMDNEDVGVKSPAIVP